MLKYSTQKNITMSPPETDTKNVARYITYPDNTGKRQAEGGLRLQGKYKQSIENKPLITVITIALNNATGLEETIQSVINQTYDNIEYIIIDGGSTDNTLEIIKKYEHAIDYFVSEPDSGIYNAMNKGIELSTGVWLNFMNSGDVFYSNSVLEDVFINNFNNVDIIYGSLYLDRKDVVVVTLPDILEKDFLYKDTLPHQASFIKNKLFNLYGLYSEKYKISSDYEKWFIYLIKNDCKYKKVNIIIAKYNFCGISSNKDNLPTILKEHMEILSSVYGYRKAKRILKSRENNENTFARKRTFLEHVFSVYTEEKFVIIYIFGVRVSIGRKVKVL